MKTKAEVTLHKGDWFVIRGEKTVGGPYKKKEAAYRAAWEMNGGDPAKWPGFHKKPVSGSRGPRELERLLNSMFRRK